MSFSTIEELNSSKLSIIAVKSFSIEMLLITSNVASAFVSLNGVKYGFNSDIKLKYLFCSDGVSFDLYRSKIFFISAMFSSIDNGTTSTISSMSSFELIL